MNVKKYGKLGIGILCTVLLMAGCGGKQKETKVSKFQDQKEYRPMSNLTEADEGAYYIEIKDDYMVLKYVDKASAKETVLCQKVNCRHDSKECPAVADDSAFLCCMTYSDGKLYYMVSDFAKEGVLDLYSMDKDGTNKKLLHEFKNQRTVPNGAGLYKGKIVMSLPSVEEFEDGTGYSSAEPSLVIYDLETEKVTTIIDENAAKDKFTIPCGGSGDTIYFAQISFYEEETGCVFKQYNFKTEEIRTVYEGTKNDLQFIIDDRMYLCPEGEKKMELYDLKTKERETVLEWEEEVDAVYVRDGYLEFKKETKENEKRKKFYNWYDLKEKKYLFEEYQSGEEIQVKERMDHGYWIQKNNQVYFYRLEDESWEKVKEIE